jgi:uncharacterized protein YfkK (UPF0435 family)
MESNNQQTMELNNYETMRKECLEVFITDIYDVVKKSETMTRDEKRLLDVLLGTMRQVLRDDDECFHTHIHLETLKEEKFV